MFDGGMDIFQGGILYETFEVASIRWCERAGEVSVVLKCVYIHEVGLNSRADLFAELGENVEAAIIYIGPEEDRCLFGDKVEEITNGGGGVAHEAEGDVRNGAWCVTIFFLMQFSPACACMPRY